MVAIMVAADMMVVVGRSRSQQETVFCAILVFLASSFLVLAIDAIYDYLQPLGSISIMAKYGRLEIDRECYSTS